MLFDFTTTTHGKWILAGEHAVLRGHPALVFPITTYQLSLQYSISEQPATLLYNNTHDDSFKSMFSKLMDCIARRLSIPVQLCNKGHFTILNTIPVGVGMGASAALCVAFARWCVWQKWIQVEELLIFARELEHLFHGQSSGLDVVGVAMQHGVYFQQGNYVPLQLRWSPHLYLSFSGQSANTLHCTSIVKQLLESQPIEAEFLDKKMSQAVQQARIALEDPQTHSTALLQLQQAIQQAAECFQAWQLMPEPFIVHMQQLIAAGALAVKPTGSGCGLVCSLWANPPVNIAFDLIKLTINCQ